MFRLREMSQKVFWGSARHSEDIFNSYPPRSKSKALRLGVHLILYFIRISLLIPKIFVLFCGCRCWCCWRTFFVFKSHNNNIVYTSGIDVYVCKRNRCTTKVLWVLKFWEVGGQDFFFKITAGRTLFNFSMKTSSFELVFSLFE